MSKERARRREEREREAAVRAAARAAEEERRARAAGRRQRFSGLRPGSSRGRQVGTLARRRRQETTMFACGLLVVNLLIWFTWGSPTLSVLAAMVTLLAAPVLHTLLFPRPR